MIKKSERYKFFPAFVWSFEKKIKAIPTRSEKGGSMTRRNKITEEND
jgi:hypothetical protein